MVIRRQAKRPRKEVNYNQKDNWVDPEVTLPTTPLSAVAKPRRSWRLFRPPHVGVSLKVSLPRDAEIWPQGSPEEAEGEGRQETRRQESRHQEQGPPAARAWRRQQENDST